ncbi:hypothetical protein PIB30_033451 [Stylosanthes scabra]|uniref:Dirigent protein n=1 Tax=Stylosanthes scabra TaxID=79078 RepID=A0ABU6UB92_9FABA|nr:hypothetical protein [Stylosanthes scabra]
MHDILGGSTPSERIVSGVITNTQTTKIPFSKPNNRILPMKGSIPIADTSSSSIYASPTTSTTTVVKDIGKNKVSIAKSNQLPPNLLFGRITVIDDEITKGLELGSEVIGKAQGFHLATSLDGSSRTMAFTAIFRNEKDDEEEEDGVSFFGVHRTAAAESHLAVVGGTGKYGNAKGSIDSIAIVAHQFGWQFGRDDHGIAEVYVARSGGSSLASVRGRDGPCQPQ